uniref:Uncharacterized protein n=1 Tax=Nelumbo nucifera TaxID=4432 RepID=A0A822ZPB2_NELNU|nr:TPA_asm: hypothetical protein HUJ06_016674 [Nelumbo nucifera]
MPGIQFHPIYHFSSKLIFQCISRSSNPSEQGVQTAGKKLLNACWNTYGTSTSQFIHLITTCESPSTSNLMEYLSQRDNNTTLEEYIEALPELS